MPRVVVTRRRAVGFVVFILAGVGFLYFVLPNLAGVGTAVHHIEHGDKWWIAIGVLFELLSFAGYVVLFRAVFVRGPSRIGWLESYQITMAGVAATRLFAAAGAGGVALTAWALRRSGMEPRLVACRMVAFIVLLYSIYMGSLRDRRHRARHRPVPGGRLVRDHDRSSDRGGGRARAGRCDGDAARRYRAAPGQVGVRLGPRGPLGGPGRDGARAGGQRHSHGDRVDPLARSRAAGSRGMVGL